MSTALTAPEDMTALLGESLEAALTPEALAKLRKKLTDAMVDIGDELEYNLKDSLANSLASHAESMADAIVTALLLGDEDRLRFYLKCPVGGFTGRDGDKQYVIRGELHESGGIEIRHRIVDAYAELLKTERILDLESQVRGLTSAVAKLEATIERIPRNG